MSNDANSRGPGPGGGGSANHKRDPSKTARAASAPRPESVTQNIRRTGEADKNRSAPPPTRDDKVNRATNGTGGTGVTGGSSARGDVTAADKPVADEHATARVRPPAPDRNRPGNRDGNPAPHDTSDGSRHDGAARPGLGGLGATAPKTKSTPKRGPAPSRTPRRAHLILRRIEPWSAMKFSFVVSLVCFVVLFVAVAVLYGVLSGLGVFDSIEQTVNSITSGDGGKSTTALNVASWFEPVRILGYTALIGAVNVVLITALATLGAVIYNISSDLVGGIEVTFSEAE